MRLGGILFSLTMEAWIWQAQISSPTLINTNQIHELLTLILKDFKRANTAGHIEAPTAADVIKNGV